MAEPSRSCSFDEPDYGQENHRPNDGVDDRRTNAADKNKSKPWQEPAGNNRADNADHDIANKPKPA
jgi:hypothetical protein